MLPNYGKALASIAARIAAKGDQAAVPNPPPSATTNVHIGDLRPRPASLDETASPEEARHFPQAVYDASKYSDGAQILAPIPANLSVVALRRPPNRRTLLIIQNPMLALPLYFAFGAQASNLSNWIPAGGTAFFDAEVPQNDLYLFVGAAPQAIPIMFANKDIAAV